ncbi:MAG: polyprenyl synthetase family protein [Nitrococcus sp.]|nr:polyprenyl synthetase family protein [Nitrococcus sp.]
MEAALERWLPPAQRHPARLHEAMRYAVLGGGKRMRPLLVYATGDALRLPRRLLDAPACAVELIHCYSLVHDDLPAMDDDDLRRGRPTCHRAYDEVTAILVGDALQSLAFRVLSYCTDDEAELAPQRLRMIDVLSLAAGSRGMAGGQSLDHEAVGRELTVPELEDMHIHKTGALIRASVMLAALADTTLSEAHTERLDHYAKCVGLAFQVQDDILDVIGEEARLGKSQGADVRLNKPTYPALLGLRQAQDFARRLCHDALANVQDFGPEADCLREVAEYIVARDH